MLKFRSKAALAAGVASCALAFGACFSFVAQAADTQLSAAASDIDEVVVIGSGETRSVSTLVPSNLEVLPPGTSVQKALNVLPGVSAHSIDALGVNEQSLSLQVRGFNTTHLGYTLDGMPLGDGAYNNYNGLTISRALISENLGRADLATGIAGLGIPSTSNLGGAMTYFSSNPREDFGFAVNGTLGSEGSKRTYLRVDTGLHGGFSAYISGQYSEQDLFVNQPAYNTSYGRQLNAKAMYEFERGLLTAFADLSRTNQADDTYLSKDMRARLGNDWGGYAPNWTDYVARAACGVPSLAARCVPSTAPEKLSDVTFTNGQILRNDDLYYLAGDVDATETFKLRGQVYHHKDKGAGNNFITGLSNQGTATTADDLPVQIRDTRYTIDRTGGLGSFAWEIGFNRVQGGFWIEGNTSSAARYIWTNVTGPFSLAHYLSGQPDTAQWVQETKWKTRQFYIQDTVKLFDDTLSVDFGFKSTYATSDAKALPGIAKTPAAAASQFASGSLKAEDNFLPQVGVHWQVAPEHELYASYAENMAMFQGGFKLGPQSVSQAVWDAQGKYLKPETSKSFDGGYRYVTGPLQVALAGYYVKFNDRLLQYNPCPTNQQQNPGCGNSFHNAGGVTSKGVELGVLWKATDWLDWYNSASLNKTTYDATSALDREARARATGLVLEMFGSENIPLKTDEILLLRDAHPDVPPVISNNLTNLRDAFIAGQILVKALRLAKHLPEKASVANAIKIVSYGFRNGSHPLGRSAMLSIWGRFKCVSHLSGAFFANGKALRPMAELIQIISDLPEQTLVTPERQYTKREKKALAKFYELFVFKPFEDALTQSYPNLFAAAEALRMHGENHYAHGQKVRGLPLLDPTIMWAVPNMFKLPKTVIDYGPPITDLEKRIILKSN